MNSQKNTIGKSPKSRVAPMLLRLLLVRLDDPGLGLWSTDAIVVY